MTLWATTATDPASAERRPTEFGILESTSWRTQPTTSLSDSEGIRSVLDYYIVILDDDSWLKSALSPGSLIY
jgi:hypothetical protein